jgi:hypothetical protein
VDGEGDFSQNNGSPNYRIDNAGTFIKRGAGTTTVINNPVFFASTGTVQLEAGILTLQNAFTQSGILSGTGTLIANVTNPGIVRPDPTPGGISIQGTFSQTAAGRLELILGGPDATLGHRSFRVTGAATLNGTLAIALASPFDEPQGAILPIVSFASRSGDFSAAEGLAGNFGYNFTRSFTATTLDLTVTTKGSVPGPIVGAAALPVPGPAVGWPAWRDAQQRRAGARRIDADADDDGDGLANLVEYAVGTDPLDPVSGVTPIEPVRVESADGPRFGIAFRRIRSATDIGYVVEVSENLRDWRANDAGRTVTTIHTVETDPVDDKWERVTETLADPAGTRPRYFRLKIVLRE